MFLCFTEHSSFLKAKGTWVETPCYLFGSWLKGEGLPVSQRFPDQQSFRKQP